MDIESIYNAYLKEEEKTKQRDKNVFHASSAGSCYRKQMYSYYDYPSDVKDDKSYRLLRLGTIVHGDVEKALTGSQVNAFDLWFVADGAVNGMPNNDLIDTDVNLSGETNNTDWDLTKWANDQLYFSTVP